LEGQISSTRINQFKRVHSGLHAFLLFEVSLRQHLGVFGHAGEGGISERLARPRGKFISDAEVEVACTPPARQV
jgi:hypothetical protein